jgi:YndJ-like protein
MNRNALIGAAIWIALFAAARMQRLDLEWIDLLFLFAPLVIVPLGLQLIGQVEHNTAPLITERIARVIQLPCALAVVTSFFLSRGMLAAVLAGTWLVFCGLLALGGATRIYKGAFRSLNSTLPVFAFLYLPVGAAWFVASRFGLTPLGFQEPIVLLTAVHFHYAGFAAPLLARSSRAALAQSLKNPLSTVLVNVIASGVVIGPGLLAVGFVAGPRVKLAAAVLLAASELGLAITFLFALGQVRRVKAKVLIALSSLSVAIAMVLAVLWAVGEYPLQPFVHLAEMARFHGTANAFGFTLCGLLGWTGAQGSSRRSGSES